MSLAPPLQRLKPKTIHLILEGVEFAMVAWHGVVSEVALYDASKPPPHRRGTVVQALPELLFDLGEFRPHAFSDRLP